MPFEKIELDAFSDGQIDSKLWLCHELERLAADYIQEPAGIWILGGWYGLLGFLLMARQRLAITNIRSFDLSETATPIANQINKNWEIKNWGFRAFSHDANELEYLSKEFGPPPQIVLNTSCEHFKKLTWWDRIPQGTLVGLQSTDMHNDDHCHRVQSIGQMKDLYGYGFERIAYEGEKYFSYPEWSFTRFMLIGIKK
jgi:hypothetical protein